MDKPLEQQVVVITGASSGIGLATAVLAAQRGASVVLTARSAAVLAELQHELESAGCAALALPADVGTRAELDAVAQAAIERFGRIDTWINNAGVSVYGRIDEVGDDDAERVFRTNFWGVVHGSRVALPWLRQTRGTLVNVGSEASEAPLPLQGIYAASKHAVKGFTDALRVELSADGAPVGVVLIQPTAVDTPFPEHAGNYLAQEPKLPTPMIEPERVAEAILDAAVDPKRSVKVGAMASVNTTLAKLAPALAERMAALQMGRQQRDEPAQRPREGTLYRAGESGRIHGRGNANAADPERAMAQNTR